MSGDSDIGDEYPPPAKKVKKEKQRKTFNNSEKDALLDIISHHPDRAVLTSARNDKETITKKNETWDAIHQQFNAKLKTDKWALHQLKNCFKNYRSDVKKAVSDHKAHQKQTGGGGPSSLPADISRAQAILNDDLKALDNPFDSDANYYSQDEVIDPDEYSRSKESAGKQQFSTPKRMKLDDEPQFIRKKAASVKHEASTPVSVTSFRQKEHEAMMNNMKLEEKKLMLEMDLLEKKGKLMDMKIRHQEEMLGNNSNNMHPYGQPVNNCSFTSATPVSANDSTGDYTLLNLA
jgi:hypothetical protein